MELSKVKNYDEMSMEAAKIVFQKIVDSNRLVLGLATGSTPEKMYEYLAEMLNKNKVDLSHVYTVNLDEYVGLSPEDEQSYHYYMREIFFDKVALPLENTKLPNGVAQDLARETREYDEMIDELGGVDLQILGIGRNAHIAFNEPGTSFESGTHVVDLTESTIQDNARFFDKIEDVPVKAVSMGLGTIMNAKSILLMASGEGKRQALKNMIHGEITEEVPASILQRHHDVKVITDVADIEL
ncbi:glucosamine-6-phosphate deaminase [Salinicoccus carnicancri]|uniref:glucosamine-6-phosphate deaminase n=1 Tax=Salinicoccus carnicancri TaxID=558170 RepID=UPI0002DEB039|nr:glucosamine-6-phosphate deaminase [Salinicoccus carnicancri]